MKYFVIVMCLFLCFKGQGQSWKHVAHYHYVLTDIHYSDSGTEFAVQQQGQVLVNGDTIRTFPTLFSNEMGLLAIEEYYGSLILHISGADHIQRVILWDTLFGILDTIIEVPYTSPVSNNHVGGDLVVVDSMLYCSFGDGTDSWSSQDDQDLRGKIIQVNLEAMSATIWAKGLRNPFRMTHNINHLWVADPGEDIFEEVDTLLFGYNAGWPCYEGTYEYIDSCGVTVPPIFEYSQAQPRAIIGGVFFQGHYYWADQYSTSGGMLDTNGNNQYVEYPLGVTTMALNPADSTLRIGTFNGDVYSYEPPVILALDSIPEKPNYQPKIDKEWQDFLDRTRGNIWWGVDGRFYSELPNDFSYYYNFRLSVWELGYR